MGSQVESVKVKTMSRIQLHRKRKISGDNVSETSGYGSNTESSKLQGTLANDEAEKILDLNKSLGCPVLHCINFTRGCPVTSYPKILTLHQEICQYPEIKKLTVKNKMNLHIANDKCFKIFCRSFEKSKQVLFLYKRTTDGSSVKIRAQHYGKEQSYSFILTFYDMMERHIFKIKDKTGLKMHEVPAEVFDEVGNIVKYKIQ